MCEYPCFDTESDVVKNISTPETWTVLRVAEVLNESTVDIFRQDSTGETVYSTIKTKSAPRELSEFADILMTWYGKCGGILSIKSRPTQKISVVGFINTSPQERRSAFWWEIESRGRHSLVLKRRTERDDCARCVLELNYIPNSWICGAQLYLSNTGTTILSWKEAP